MSYMDTTKVKIIHPDTHDLMEIDAPVSKLKIPIDIFIDGQDILIIRFKSARKRRATIEQNEKNQPITKVKGRTWKLAAVAVITKETALQFNPPLYQGNYKEVATPADAQWNYSTHTWRSANGVKPKNGR